MSKIKTYTKNQGELIYVTDKVILKAGDFAYCTETCEVIEIAKILDVDNYYEDVNGKRHYDNHDPWNWRKIIKTNDHRIHKHSDEVLQMSRDEYFDAIMLDNIEIPLPLIDKHRNSFTKIYENGKEVNPIPPETKLTIYCESNDGDGYLTNLTEEEGGLSLLVAKSWILETDLRKLVFMELKNNY